MTSLQGAVIAWRVEYRPSARVLPGSIYVEFTADGQRLLDLELEVGEFQSWAEDVADVASRIAPRSRLESHQPLSWTRIGILFLLGMYATGLVLVVAEHVSCS
jgi:hypothetical protein